MPNYLGFLGAAVCLFWLSGCKSGTAGNVITVSVSSSAGTTLILGQSTTLTAIVGGATNTNVNWQPCQFTTTTTSGTTTTTSKPAACPSDGTLGTLSNEQTTGTATFTAPSTLPDQTKYPGLLVVLTAQSAQSTSKSGSISLAIDSGISVTFTPVTATVPTNEKQQFNPVLSNDLKNQGVTWLVTQATPTSTTPFPKLASCTVAGNATGCGSIDANGLYSAPAVVPTSTTSTSTPANVTVVATSVGDNTRFATGTITLIAGGPITFNGISPHSAPQGAAFWDIFLDAPNISSASKITLSYSDGHSKTFTSDLAQTKVLFPIPTSTTATPPSSGARLRLKDTDLLGTGTVTVSVTDSGQTVTAPNLAAHPEFYTFDLKAARPTSVSSVPDGIVQGAQIGDTRVVIDGGYFGPGGGLVKVVFQGNEIPKSSNNNTPSTARQLNLAFPTGTVNTGNPGLYQLPVAYTGTAMPPPSPNNPSITSLAVFPDYSINPPQLLTSLASPAVSAGTNPGAIDLDPTLGVVVVAETGSNGVQFYKIVPPTPTSLETVVPIDSSGTNCVNSCPVPVGRVPTGLSVNRIDHTVAVVNYQDQSVTVLPIPVPGAAQQTPAPGTPFTVDISGAFQGAFQGSSSAIPFPYAIGVDPDTKLALVAYSSTATSSNINLGFIVNLNLDQGGNPFGCPLLTTTQTGQCLYSQVTLNTGAYPQIAMTPHGHQALVSPGGSGVVQGVDVTRASTSTAIAGASLTAGTVTITTSVSHKLIPGNSGTVLITGVSKGANGTDFNGVYTVAATSDTTFIFTLNSTVSDTGTGGTVFYSNPNLTFSISSTTQGIAINPITRTAALADANSTGSNGPQIDLLSSLDQAVTSITFRANCTAFTPVCTNAPELLGTTNVAWQPYSNALVSYNPKQKQVSVSDPISRNRYAIVANLGPSAISFPVTNGTTNSITLWGGIVVDPATNHAFVLESGAAATSTTPAIPGQIEIINLGPNPSNNLKPTQITELVVPSPAPGPNSLGGIPMALVPQATLSCTTPVPPATTCDLPGVQIFGSGFGAVANTTTQVRLDGMSINGLCSPPNPTACVNVVSDREIDVTIPATIPTGDPNNPTINVLELPHRYALDVSNGTVQSNATDFIVVKAVDLSKVCTGANPQPNSVALVDQVASGPFSPIAIVSNGGCNSISIIDIKPTMEVTVNGQPETVANPNFGTVQNTVAVGTTPQGIAISQRLGVAVVANNGTNNASIIDLTKNPPVPFAVSPVATGTNPAGVAINEATGAAIVANTGSNTISEINLSLLFPSTGTPPTTLTATSIGGIQQPIAVAIDPDRGTNNLGIAAVTSVQLVSGSVPNGAITVVEIGSATPTISTTSGVGSVSVTPSGIVFDPIAVTNTASSGLFYTNSSGSNVITSFNPDSLSSSSVSVGINPTSLALNPQTGAILTSNSASNTISIVDTLSNPLKTRQTIGIPGSQQFGVAIDQFTNLAVIVDQANSRVLLFPMPN
jgi:DNA-binding beta-propeller fold protein YncE